MYLIRSFNGLLLGKLSVLRGEPHLRRRLLKVIRIWLTMTTYDFIYTKNTHTHARYLSYVRSVRTYTTDLHTKF